MKKCKKADCVGCEDNYYNHSGNSHTGECWGLKTAKMKLRYRTGTWTMPLSPGAFTEVRVPSCFHCKGSHFTDKPHPEAVGVVRLR